MLFRSQQATADDPAIIEAQENVAAMTMVLNALSGAPTANAAIRAALDAVREAFGWAYGSYWRIDPEVNALTFAMESGSAGEEFRQVTLAASFKEGVGLSGRTWRSRDLYFVEDLGEMTDCVRAPAAQRAGVKSGVCFPLFDGGRVVGTMDFFATETLAPSKQRLDTLRAVGLLTSQAIERVIDADRQRAAASDLAAVNAVLRAVATAATEDEATAAALNTVRAEFGWAYGSYWALDEASRSLKFVLESGSAGEEFRQVTLTASFKEGVGLSGRTWRARELVFVKDLGEVTDCVRAPAAQRAGVKSGVCLPIIVEGQVVGTMDFFATETLTLSESRLDALRNTAFLVSQAIERTRAAGRVAEAGRSLVSSISEVQTNVSQASQVADDAQRLTADANEIVNRLSASSAEIGKVISVITAIAGQTNLLALNATIEAARAGEAGKGFSVVATEVKDLARETAKATDEVGAKIAAIQNDAESVVEALSGIQDIVARINDTQSTITGVVHEQTTVVNRVLSES